MVVGEAVELVDDHGEVGGEAGEDAAESGHGVVAELAREEVVGHRADDHCGGGDGGRRREEGLRGGQVGLGGGGRKNGHFF